MTESANLLDVLGDQLADTETAWSLGTFGAIAEFTRDADETAISSCDDQAVSVVTARGGLRIEVPDGLRAIASESLTSKSWSQRVALCLPEETCVMSKRTVLTEIGPDREALRAGDRRAVLFDLGLGALQVDCCVRSSDPTFVAALRECVGKSLFAQGNGAMYVILAANPHRVFLSRIGRVEVFQPIPPPDGKSPSGPHTHVLPKLLRSGRTHAATEPLPLGWIPCAHFYPPSPTRDGYGRPQPFRHERHTAFQLLLARYGDAQLVDLKRRVVDSVAAEQSPSAVSVAANRYARATVRIALRQLKALDHPSSALAAWLSAYDRLEIPETDGVAKGRHCPL